MFRGVWTWLVGETPRDDRGRPVRIAFLFVGGYPSVLWGRINRLPADVQERIGKALRDAYQGRSSQGFVLGVIAMIPWIATLVIHHAYRHSSFVHSWTFLLVQGSAFVCGLAPLPWWFHKRAARRIASALIFEGYCPCCRYQLAGTPPQLDGCSVCPECGAAWRLPPWRLSPPPTPPR
jgi:hypothetical protein